MKKNFVVILLLSFNLVGCSYLSNNSNTQTTSKPELTFNPTNTVVDVQSVIPSEPTKAQPISDINKIYSNLELLCKTPRDVGSNGIKQAKEIIVSKMKEYDYDVTCQDFSYTKTSPLDIGGISTSEEYFTIQFNDESNNIDATNIIARKQYDDSLMDLYICAHYDTTKNTNGEIDNGSGVVAVLDLARKLYSYNLPVNIIFVFFSAEETGMSGSSYFVSTLTQKQKEKAIGCINIDCICLRNYDSKIYKNIVMGSENVLSLYLNKLYDFEYGMSSNSDHLSFYYGEIPAVSFTDWPYAVTDDVENIMNNIDIEKIDEFTNLFFYFIINFSIEEYMHYKENNSSIEYSIKDTNSEILGYKLKSISQEMNSIGSRSKFRYTFLNNENQEITFIKDNKRFTESSEIKKINEGKEYNDICYYVYQTANQIEVHYYLKNNSTQYGILIGNLTEIEALRMIETGEQDVLSIGNIQDYIVYNN